MMRARAYVNWGRWVADCPYACGCALVLEPREALFACRECHTISQVEWPPNPDEIWGALVARKIPRTRNWYPVDHPLAVAAGVPHGQSVADLHAESEAHRGLD